MTLSHEEEPTKKRSISEEDPIISHSTKKPPGDTCPPPRKRNAKFWYIVISLVYANFWMAASVSLQAPFFPREAESKGATPTQYGLVFGVFELVVIIMSPIYGKLIPRISPKFLITSGVLLGGAACCVFGALDYVPAGKTYIALAFLVRIFEGFGAAALMTASFTIIAAAFPDSVATSFSLVETSFGFGLIVGPTIGGALYQAGGFLLPFLVNGSFLLVGSIILYFLLPKIEDSERHEGSRNLFSFLADGGIISYTLSIISSLLFIGFNAATLEPHLRKYDLKPVVLGAIFIITGGIYAITTPIWGRICDKGTDPLIIDIFGYTLTCAGILVIGPAPFIPFTPTVWTIVGSLVVIGLGLSAKLVSSFVGALRNTSNILMVGTSFRDWQAALKLWFLNQQARMCFDTFDRVSTCMPTLTAFLFPYSAFVPGRGFFSRKGLHLQYKNYSLFGERGFPDNLATYGMVSALVSTSCSIGAFIGPSIGGFLLENTGYRMGTVYIFAFEVFFMAVLILYMIVRFIRRKKKDIDPCEKRSNYKQFFL